MVYKARGYLILVAFSGASCCEKVLPTHTGTHDTAVITVTFHTNSAESMKGRSKVLVPSSDGEESAKMEPAYTRRVSTCRGARARAGKVWARGAQRGARLGGSECPRPSPTRGPVSAGCALPASHLAGDHDGVPALDLDCDHEQLGQDERGERDPHHVHQPAVEEEDGAEHDHAALVDGLPRPDEEGLEREVAPLLQLAVELGELERILRRDVLQAQQGASRHKGVCAR